MIQTPASPTIFDALGFGTAGDSVVYASQFASLQAAHDALPATGGTIMLPPNTAYVVAGATTISKNNVTLQGTSWSTVVQRSPTYTSSVLINVTGANCCINGFTIDGNSVVTNAFELATSGNNSLVSEMQIINSAGAGHLSLAGVNSRATGNTVTGLGTSLSTQRGYGIWAVNHQPVQIDHNTVSGTGIDGIGFDGSGSMVSDNFLTNCHNFTGGGGGQIVYYAIVGNVPNSVIISSNTIRVGGSFSDGLEIVGDNVIVSNNTVDGVGGYGIILEGLSSDLGRVIANNLVRNTGTGGSLDGISVQPGVSNFQIIGNRVVDDQGTHTMRDAINVVAGASDNYIIANNFLTPNGRTAISDSGTGLNKVVRDNIGVDNIVGSIASAATLTFTAVPSPVLTLTGTTGVTAVGGNLWTGRQLTLIPAGAVTFTAGATIGNTMTTSAGVPVIATFDGTKLWLK